MAAAAANLPTLPPMIPLPSYLARKTALSRLGPANPPPVQTDTATPFQMWGGPTNFAPQPGEGPLIDLSPPPGHRASTQARFQGMRPDATQMQNVMWRSYANNDHLSMSIPREFDASYPPMVSRHPYEAFHRSDIRSASQESPMPGSRPLNADVSSSIGDLDL